MFKALITTLAIVGSSSVAMARPASSTSVQTVSVQGSASASLNFGFDNGQRIRSHWEQPSRQPVVIRDHRTGNGYGYYEPRYDRAARFDVLDDNLQFTGMEYRKDIMLGVGAGRFSTLKLEGDWGRSYLLKVVVEFADGASQQQIDLNRTLREGQQLTLDLTGGARTITRVMVYRADGSLGQLGNHSGAFTVSAK